MDGKTLDGRGRYAPAIPASERVAQQSAALEAIVSTIPRTRTGLQAEPWLSSLYSWMREVVHAGRELDAVEYVIRRLDKLDSGEWGPVDLRAKVVASFTRDDVDERMFPMDLVDEPEMGPRTSFDIAEDEAAIVLNYLETATGIRLAEPAQNVMAIG
jgi:hypothetical protein